MASSSNDESFARSFVSSAARATAFTTALKHGRRFAVERVRGLDPEGLRNHAIGYHFHPALEAFEAAYVQVVAAALRPPAPHRLGIPAGGDGSHEPIARTSGTSGSAQRASTTSSHLTNPCRGQQHQRAPQQTTEVDPLTTADVGCAAVDHKLVSLWPSAPPIPARLEVVLPTAGYCAAFE